MIPECIVLPYIGIRNGCDDSSSSGFYINDLEGISLKLASDLTNGEVVRGEDLIRQKERVAIIDTIRDMKLIILQELKMKDIIHEERITGNWGDYMAVDRVGIRIRRCNSDMSRIESRQICLFPEDSLTITVNVEEDGSVRQIAKDVIGGKENCITIDLKSNAQDILIYVNLCGHRLRKVNNCACDCNECGGCFTVSHIKYGDNDDCWIGGWPLIKTNILCRCNWDELICIYKDMIAQAVMYRLGIKLLYEVVFTQNYNGLIANSRESAQELLKIWEGVPGQFAAQADNPFDIHSEYYKSLRQAVEMAKDYIIEHSGLCASCKGYKVLTHCFN